MSCNFEAPYYLAPSPFKFSMDPKPSKINPYLALEPALISKLEDGDSWHTAVPLFFLSLLKKVIITPVCGLYVLFD